MTANITSKNNTWFQRLRLPALTVLGGLCLGGPAEPTARDLTASGNATSRVDTNPNSAAALARLDQLLISFSTSRQLVPPAKFIEAVLNLAVKDPALKITPQDLQEFILNSRSSDNLSDAVEFAKTIVALRPELASATVRQFAQAKLGGTLTAEVWRNKNNAGTAETETIIGLWLPEQTAADRGIKILEAAVSAPELSISESSVQRPCKLIVKPGAKSMTIIPTNGSPNGNLIQLSVALGSAGPGEILRTPQVSFDLHLKAGAGSYAAVREDGSELSAVTRKLLDYWEQTQCNNTDIERGLQARAAAAKTLEVALGLPAPKIQLEDWPTEAKLGENMLKSQELKLAGTITVLDFWATWCTPCQRAMPGLSATQEKFGKDVRVVSLCKAGPRNSNGADGVAARYKQLFAISSDETWGKYVAGAIPRVVVIGRDGNVLAIDPEDLNATLTAALVSGN